MVILDFVCWCAVVALASAFALSLARKWGVIEWLQVHAPTEFLGKLFSCKFCLSWWVSVGISVILWLAVGQAALLLAPICSTLIARELW